MIKHPVSPKHLQSIGDITVSFALLELALQMLVGSMLNENQKVGRIISVEMSFRNLRAVMISLFIEKHGKDDQDFPKLKALIKRSSEIEARRNQITHSIWGAGTEPNAITRIKTTAKEKHGLKFDSENVTANDLANFANEIKVLVRDIDNFGISLIDQGKAVNNPL